MESVFIKDDLHRMKIMSFYIVAENGELKSLLMKVKKRMKKLA